MRPREQPPPAPRNTTQFLATERGEEFGNPEDSCDGDLPTSARDSELDRSLAADADFLSAYDAAIYEPLEAWSVRELIQRIRERDHDVDLLHAETRELRSRNEGFEGEIMQLRAQIVELKSNGAAGIQGEADAVASEVEDEEADAFAEGGL